MAENEQKRAPGGSPALFLFVRGARAILTITTVLVALIAGWAIWQWYRPEHFLNPINRFAILQLYQARDGHSGSTIAHWQASMAPSVFAPGEPRSEVARRLAEAGYSAWVDDGKSLIYRLDLAGTAALVVCRNDFLVDLTFDSEAGLVSAESTTVGACM